jgi:ribosome-associated heat shock protein Hsp15
MTADPQAPTLRVDKWLWFARFFKSRTIAADVCKTGKVRVSGTKIDKPSHGVRAGDVLTFPQGRHIRVIRIVALGSRRGPASEARELFEDVDPPQPSDSADAAPPPGADRGKGAGRPTKKERRELDKVHPKGEV